MGPLTLAIQNVTSSELGTVCYIGAGTGGWVEDIASLKPENIAAYEASEELCSALINKCKKHNIVEVHNQWVLPVDINECEATIYQNPRYNSLVRKENSHTYASKNFECVLELVTGVPLNLLIESLSLDLNKANILIVDVDDELESLQIRSNQHLRSFSHIFIVSKKSFSGSHYLLGDCADFVYCPQVFSKDSKEFTILVRNEQKLREVELLNGKLQKLNEELQNKNAQLDLASNDLSESRKQILELAKNKDDAIERLNNSEQKCVNKDKTLKELSDKLKESQNELITLQSQLSAAIDSTKVNKEVLETIIDQFQCKDETLAEIKRKVNWMIDRGLNNAVKQVESFIGVQSFLEKGEMGMQFHGWPISSDIALYLLGQIKEHNYDLIIEFGSGTSTLLFAKAMAFEENIFAEDRDASTEELALSEAASRVVSFEHNKKYFEKTQQLLRQRGLLSFVNLIHAPLVDITSDGESFLYYDCETELNNIASKFMKQQSAKILVLVDGPPGDTGPLARFPAVSKLLNTLGQHQLDIVLDDSNRDEEKKIISKWKDTLEARFVSFDEEEIPCEKGAYILRLNP